MHGRQFLVRGVSRRGRPRFYARVPNAGAGRLETCWTFGVGAVGKMFVK